MSGSEFSPFLYIILFHFQTPATLLHTFFSPQDIPSSTMFALSAQPPVQHLQTSHYIQINYLCFAQGSAQNRV